MLFSMIVGDIFMGGEDEAIRLLLLVHIFKDGATFQCVSFEITCLCFIKL